MIILLIKELDIHFCMTYVFSNLGLVFSKTIDNFILFTQRYFNKFPCQYTRKFLILLNSQK